MTEEIGKEVPASRPKTRTRNKPKIDVSKKPPQPASKEIDFDISDTASFVKLDNYYSKVSENKPKFFQTQCVY